MLEEVKWGEFSYETIYKLQKVQNKLTKDACVDNGTIPLFTADSKNNGIIGYVNLPPTYIVKEGEYWLIFGDHTRTFNLTNKSFCIADNVKVLKPINNFSLSILQFVNSCWKKQIKNKGYARHWSIAKNIKIELPILEDGTINFIFMEKFIAELEATHLAELDAYLSVTGLKDYELTEEERQALEDFENKEWVNPKIKDLFKVNSYKKRFDANKVTILEKGEYPYIVRTAFNNGVRGYLKEDTDYLNDENTISFGQDTATMFYQKTPYFTGDKIKILKHKDKNFNEEKALFLITSMRKSFKSFTWGAKSYSEKVIKSQKIKVPQIDKEIDYEFMEIFISAIKKLVIKDVVEFSNKKIETTKEIINK